MKTKDFSKHENQDKLWQKVDLNQNSNTKYMRIKNKNKV
jgi:hypothetical protein